MASSPALPCAGSSTQTATTGSSSRAVRSPPSEPRAPFLTPELRTELVTLAQLAAPICVANLASFGLQIVSQMVVGRVSAAALGACALAGMFVAATGLAPVFGTANACDTLCSEAFGARNLPRVGLIARRGIAVALASAVVVVFVWALGSGPFFRALGIETELAEDAEAFVHVLIFGLPAQVVYEVLKKPLISVGLAGVATGLSFTGLLTSALLSPLLVFGFRMGFLGAAWATVVAHWVTLGSFLGFLRWHRALHATARGCARGLRAAAGGAGAVQGLHRAEAHAAQGLQSEAQLAVQVLPAQREEARAAASPREKAHTQALVAAGGERCADTRELVAPGAEESARACLEEARAPSCAVSMSAGAEGAARLEPKARLDPHDILDAVFPSCTLNGALGGWGEYMALGLPSAAMLFVEWGSFEGEGGCGGGESRGAPAQRELLLSALHAFYVAPPERPTRLLRRPS